ncbi:hypothetical protein [Pseudorhodoferax sp.]|uniref:hypothetical protein n=1 Tax=Pseudorhodoferax sp. TaxID=1993553 RepID=UPI002DD6577A|nr:hypothetical protein [Pseudorhodoferax sp.]
MAAPKLPVLVPEAHAIGMIGVIRSLGRAGYTVHALSAQPDALGFLSSFAAASACHPAYDSADYLPWLLHYLERHHIAAIVPSEAFLLGVRGQIDRIAPLLPDMPEKATLYRAFSKCDVQERLLASGSDSMLQHQPRALVVDRGAAPDIEHLTAAWAWPLFVKTDGLHADHGDSAGVHAARDPSQLAAYVRDALGTHRRCMVQEAVPGVKATVNLWRHRGEIRAQSMALALHENPYSGGLTSDRVVWWHEAMAADARQRLELLEWQGVAMVEYRWDAASGRFWFLELNARYWNALNLDLFAGKDFPRWQVDAFTGRGVETSMDPGPVGLRARYTVPAEVGHVLSKCRAPEVPIADKTATVLGFAANAMRPSIRSDLWFEGDRRLYWHGLRRFVARLGHKS